MSELADVLKMLVEMKAEMKADQASMKADQASMKAEQASLKQQLASALSGKKRSADLIPMVGGPAGPVGGSAGNSPADSIAGTPKPMSKKQLLLKGINDLSWSNSGLDNIPLGLGRTLKIVDPAVINKALKGPTDKQYSMVYDGVYGFCALFKCDPVNNAVDISAGIAGRKPYSFGNLVAVVDEAFIDFESKRQKAVNSQDETSEVFSKHSLGRRNVKVLSPASLSFKNNVLKIEAVDTVYCSIDFAGPPKCKCRLCREEGDCEGHYADKVCDCPAFDPKFCKVCKDLWCDEDEDNDSENSVSCASQSGAEADEAIVGGTLRPEDYE